MRKSPWDKVRVHVLHGGRVQDSRGQCSENQHYRPPVSPVMFRWHARYMDLLAGKKAAIAHWKEAKRAESQLAALRQQVSAAAEQQPELSRIKSEEDRVLRCGCSVGRNLRFIVKRYNFTMNPG
jgi:hypothetical protein